MTVQTGFKPTTAELLDITIDVNFGVKHGSKLSEAGLKELYDIHEQIQDNYEYVCERFE